MKNILFIILVCFIAISCSHDFMYADETANILGTDMGECIEKKQVSCEAIGEWFICETYEFKNKAKTTPAHNSLYRTDWSWVAQDWLKLPICSNSEINNIVFNYSGSDKAKAISREMEEINASGCGYYSFLAKPSIEDPRYLIMCIFDTNKSKLYVVDAHL